MAASSDAQFPSASGGSRKRSPLTGAGVPVVARDLPVLREVFGDTVRFAADAPGFATEMAAALQSPPDPVIGRALAESMTWQAAAQAHLDFYRNHL